MGPSERSRFATPPTSWSDIFWARAILRRLLPLELVDAVLHHAEYYFAITAIALHPLRISASGMAIIAVTLSEKQAQTAVGLSIVIKGQECLSSETTPATWYSLGTEDPESHEEPLVYNPCAAFNRNSAVTLHEFYWTLRSPVVQQLREDKLVEVWAHCTRLVILLIVAQVPLADSYYSGTTNYVEFAKLTAYCFPF